MQRLMLSAMVLAIILILWSAQATPLHATQCTVSSNIHESFDEDRFTLVKLTSALTTEPSPLADAERAALYHALLVSMRRHHVELAMELTTCARPVSTALLEVIDVQQELLFLRLLETSLDPAQRSHRLRVERAIVDLQAAWQQVDAIMQATELTPMGR